jgi:hypothetical protein
MHLGSWRDTLAHSCLHDTLHDPLVVLLTSACITNAFLQVDRGGNLTPSLVACCAVVSTSLIAWWPGDATAAVHQRMLYTRCFKA